MNVMMSRCGASLSRRVTLAIAGSPSDAPRPQVTSHPPPAAAAVAALTAGCIPRSPKSGSVVLCSGRSRRAALYHHHHSHRHHALIRSDLRCSDCQGSLGSVCWHCHARTAWQCQQCVQSAVTFMHHSQDGPAVPGQSQPIPTIRSDVHAPHMHIHGGHGHMPSTHRLCLSPIDCPLCFRRCL